MAKDIKPRFTLKSVDDIFLHRKCATKKSWSASARSLPSNPALYPSDRTCTTTARNGGSEKNSIFPCCRTFLSNQGKTGRTVGTDLVRRLPPSLSQAVRMKKFSQEVKLPPEVIFSIMTEEKANQKEKVKLLMESLRKYFPKRYTPEEIEAEIMRMLEDRYRRRHNERNER